MHTNLGTAHAQCAPMAADLLHAAGASPDKRNGPHRPIAKDFTWTALPLHAFSFERKGYIIRIANGNDPLKRETARLIERMYSARGLFPYGTTVELDRRDLTIVALKDQRAVATLTVRLDHGSGLLADTLYRKEIDAIRAKGGRVCEITQLAIDPELGSQDALAGLLQALYALARLTERMSDVFIEVHPRHAPFYQRIFGYRLAGPRLICPRVGAAAVLLHLSQNEFEDAVARGEQTEDRRSRRAARLLPTSNDVQQLLQDLQSAG